MQNFPADATSLRALFRTTEHRLNLCVLALLTWVASCDGTLAEDELALLRSAAAGVVGGEAVLPAVIDVARLGRADDIELACRYLRNNATREQKALLAQLFVSMAAQDGHLTVAENHVLRFLADVLGLSARQFARLFEEVTHRPFPEVGDVSSVDWWRARQAGEQAHAPADGWGPGAASQGWGRTARAAAQTPQKEAMTREVALRMFGLDQGASGEQVHSAYRRLAKARHPDRFVTLGPAAQSTAAVAFRRVQEAYELLSASG